MQKYLHLTWIGQRTEQSMLVQDNVDLFVSIDETKVTELKPDGKYVLSKNKGSKSRQFSKSPR